ncbi:MAG: lipoate--protein ligase family protein [Candidatus Magnetominusculus sp. LBB02]|nr:lipoate--protein ligase family protein [Candidatus Magnetominusculus sp. LBB02]
MSEAQWRLIDYAAFEAGYNMAADEAIAMTVEAGASPPTLRFYGWSCPSVTIGAFQRIADINTGACSRLNIPVVRRPTGGRAIVHSDELTFSFSTGTNAAPFSGSVLDNYKVISTAFFRAFIALGLECAITSRRLKRSEAGPLTANPMCFKAASYSEITVMGRKIMGAAQRRYRGALLEQGSIPMSIDHRLLASVFNENADASFAGLRDFNASITLPALQTAIVKAFEQVFNVHLHPGQLDEREIALVRRLQQKYQSHEWSFRR